jgi:hypothetical protein
MVKNKLMMGAEEKIVFSSQGGKGGRGGSEVNVVMMWKILIELENL